MQMFSTFDVKRVNIGEVFKIDEPDFMPVTFYRTIKVIHEDGNTLQISIFSENPEALSITPPE